MFERESFNRTVLILISRSRNCILWHARLRYVKKRGIFQEFTFSLCLVHSDSYCSADRCFCIV